MYNGTIKAFDIKDIDTVKDFIHYLIFDLNLNFHPDTPFGDYVEMKSGIPTFTSKQYFELSKMLRKAFRVCGILRRDIYQLCMEVEQLEEHIRALKAAQDVLKRAVRAFNAIPNKRIGKDDSTYDIASSIDTVLKQLDCLQVLNQ